MTSNSTSASVSNPSSTSDIPPNTIGQIRNNNRRFDASWKRLFITWPRCDMDPAVAMSRILKSLNVEWTIVAQEKHSDQVRSNLDISNTNLP